MGLFDLFTKPAKLNMALSAPLSLSLESPNQASSLAKVVFAEYFAGETGEVTRQSALQIPALKKARDILVTLVAGLPLGEYEAETKIDQPWLYSTKSPISPWHRMAYIVDDLLFYDWSALAVERDDSAQIVDAVRIPWERWQVDEYTGKVRVDGNEVPAEEVVLIPGSGSGGLLAAGANTIKGARALERAWVGRAQNPTPLTVLQQVTDDELEDDEIDDLVDAFQLARSAPGGATAFADRRIKVEDHGTVESSLFEDGRNSIVLDVARLTGMPAALLDGSMSTATLTYSTQEGKQNEFATFSLAQWTDPIQARLSLDDVSAKGRVLRFDKAQFTVAVQSAITQPTKD